MSRAPSPDPHGPSAFECSSAGVRAGAARGCPAAARRALRRTARIPAAGARRRRAQTLHRVSDAPGRARAGMWVPGLTGLVVGAGLLLLVRDSPEAVGYPPVETVQAKPKQADGASAPKESLMSLLLNNVLKNPFIWGMAFTYFFVYVVRQGVTSWFVFYLIKARARAPGGQGGLTRRPGWRDNPCSVGMRSPASVRSVRALAIPPCGGAPADRQAVTLCGSARKLPAGAAAESAARSASALLRDIKSTTARLPGGRAGQGRGGCGLGRVPRVGPGAGRPVRQPAGGPHLRLAHRQPAQGRQRGQARAGAPPQGERGSAEHALTLALHSVGSRHCSLRHWLRYAQPRPGCMSPTALAAGLGGAALESVHMVQVEQNAA